MQTSLLSDRLGHYIRLVRMDKPIGTLLLLWPMLWALWMVSNGEPRIDVLVVFVIGTFLMRSAGCAINDYADRHIDGAVSRTKNRPIVSGDVTPKEALCVAAVLALCSFVLVLSMNRLTIAMSFIGLALAAAYPFTKRITYWPQLFLGLAFGWAVPMACAAQTGSVGLTGWAVYAAAILWALAYDTIYAMVDREDDLLLGVKSTAIHFGDRDVPAVALTLAAVLGILAWIGLLQGYGLAYFTGLLAGLIVAVYQIHLIRGRNATECFKAFLTTNYMGLVIFAGIFFDQWNYPGQTLH